MQQNKENIYHIYCCAVQLIISIVAEKGYILVDISIIAKKRKLDTFEITVGIYLKSRAFYVTVICELIVVQLLLLPVHLNVFVRNIVYKTLYCARVSVYLFSLFIDVE